MTRWLTRCFAVTIFRFLRRARFSRSGALALLRTTLTARLSLAPPALQPPNPYASRPLFFFHHDLHDRFGRPCAVLNLREVRRTPDGLLDSLKEFVRQAWEEGRERLRRKSEREGGVFVQMVLIVDLEGAGMSNLVSLARLVTLPAMAARVGKVLTAARWSATGTGDAPVLHVAPQEPLPRHGGRQ